MNINGNNFHPLGGPDEPDQKAIVCLDDPLPESVPGYVQDAVHKNTFRPAETTGGFVHRGVDVQKNTVHEEVNETV